MAELLEPQDIMFTPFEPKLKYRFIMQIGGINNGWDIGAGSSYLKTSGFLGNATNVNNQGIILYSSYRCDFMSSIKNENLQEVFLNQIRKEKVSVTLFLVNGVKLQGIITWFDNFSILLKRDTHIQLVYKHSVSTIMPAVPVSLGIEKTE